MKSNIYFNTDIVQKENQSVTTYQLSNNNCKICKNKSYFNVNDFTNTLILFPNCSINQGDLIRIFELKISHNDENHIIQDNNNQILIDISLSSDKNSYFIKPCECDNTIVHSYCLLRKCILTNSISCKICRCVYSIQIETTNKDPKLNSSRKVMFIVLFLFSIVLIFLMILLFTDHYYFEYKFIHWKYLLGILFLVISFSFTIYFFINYYSSETPLLSSIRVLDYNVDDSVDQNKFLTLLNQITNKSCEDLIFYKYDDSFYKHYLSFENNRLRSIIKKKKKEKMSIERLLNQSSMSNYITTNNFLISQAFKDKDQFLKKQHSFQTRNSNNFNIKDKVNLLKKSKTKYASNDKGSVISLNTKLIRILKENNLQDNNIKEEPEEEDMIKRKNSRINSNELLLTNKIKLLNNEKVNNSSDKKISTKEIEIINISSQHNNIDPSINHSLINLLHEKKVVPEIPRSKKRHFTQINIPQCK